MVASPTDGADDAPQQALRDGSSFERAILVDQNRWRATHCPGAELLLQKLCGDGGRYFDVLTLALPSGEVREVYFDITEQFAAGLEEPPRRRAKV
jgi:hypothetical protein